MTPFALVRQVPWKALLYVLIAALVFGGLLFLRDSSVRLGAAQERARTAELIAQAQAKALRIAQEESEKFRDATQRLDRSLSRARQLLDEVPDDADASEFLRAWADGDRSLRDGDDTGGDIGA